MVRYLFDAKDYGILLDEKEVESIVAKISTVEPSLCRSFARYFFSNLNYAEMRDGKVYVNRKRWSKPIKYGLSEFKRYLAPGGS